MMDRASERVIVVFKAILDYPGFSIERRIPIWMTPTLHSFCSSIVLMTKLTSTSLGCDFWWDFPGANPPFLISGPRFCFRRSSDAIRRACCGANKSARRDYLLAPRVAPGNPWAEEVPAPCDLFGRNEMGQSLKSTRIWKKTVWKVILCYLN